MEFTPWPKIARLNRDITITEKIDGTNAAVRIVPQSEMDYGDGYLYEDDHELGQNLGWGWMDGVDEPFAVFAQSRTRIITPGKDNFGFAAWVAANVYGLVDLLGPGLHFGEWWGKGIQRGYGMTERRFSLFNTAHELRWLDRGLLHEPYDLGLDVVPELYEGPWSHEAVAGALEGLRMYGSYAAEDYMRPEGIVIYHKAARVGFKVLLEGDELPKSLALAGATA